MVENKTEETEANPGEETPENPLEPQEPTEPEQETAKPEEPEEPTEPSEINPTLRDAKKEEIKSPEEQYSERERRYYARMKAAEEEAKKVKATLNELKKPQSEIDAILEIQYATKDLDPAEIEELKMRSSATSQSLTEARKDSNFVLWQKAYREKVEKERTPLPSGRQPEEDKPMTIQERLNKARRIVEKKEGELVDDRLREEMKEKEEILKKSGLYKEDRYRKSKVDFLAQK